MPRPKKPRPKKFKEIKLFNNEKAVEDFFGIIFHVGKKVYDNVTKKQETHVEPKPCPTPQEAENKIAPPPPVVEPKEKPIISFSKQWKKERSEILKRLN
jgi:hypothetical protein